VWNISMKNILRVHTHCVDSRIGEICTANRISSDTSNVRVECNACFIMCSPWNCVSVEPPKLTFDVKISSLHYIHARTKALWLLLLLYWKRFFCDSWRKFWRNFNYGQLFKMINSRQRNKHTTRIISEKWVKRQCQPREVMREQTKIVTHTHVLAIAQICIFC